MDPGRSTGVFAFVPTEPSACSSVAVPALERGHAKAKKYREDMRVGRRGYGLFELARCGRVLWIIDAARVRDDSVF